MNNDDKDKRKDEVIIGGISIKDKALYIGAFCEFENRYGITLIVRRIDIELKDI